MAVAVLQVPLKHVVNYWLTFANSLERELKMKTAESSSCKIIRSDVTYIRLSSTIIALLFLFSMAFFCFVSLNSGVGVNRAARLSRTPIIVDNKQEDASSNYIIASRIIQLLALVHRALNSNTTIVPLNQVTNSFNTLMESTGWRSLDLFINTLANSMTIYDTLDGAVDRADGRKRNKIQDQDNSDDEFREEVTDSLKELVEQMMTINLELKCLLIKDHRRPSECSKKEMEDDKEAVDNNYDWINDIV